VKGSWGASTIAVKSGVHRRNVYDSLNRLIERGLVFERITTSEHLYQATDPKKLLELVREKEAKIESVLPDLETLYQSVPHTNDVVRYRGLEGCKNYLRDMIRVEEDIYTIGAKGTWQDPRLDHVRSQLAQASKDKDIRMFWLFDRKVEGAHEKYLEQGFKAECRYLPPGYDTKMTIDIFGDHVVIVTDPTPGEVIDDISFTVLINQDTADAFRTWHALLWKLCEGNR
jgi:sugar-specific transcriptional regulator TrmB